MTGTSVTSTATSRGDWTWTSRRHRGRDVLPCVRDGRTKPRRTRRWIAAGVVATAATSAASKPPSTGTYWHTKLVLHTGRYTDVTDNYRLGRWARLRTDLGGF